MTLLGLNHYLKTPGTTDAGSEMWMNRIVIPPFDNETGNDEMQAFGQLVSDWISKDLMQFDELNIINADNLPEEVILKGFSKSNSHLMSMEGLKYLIRGRYFQLEDVFYLTAKIIDVKSFEEQKVFQVEGPASDKSTLLKSLSQKILDYWNIKDLKRFRSDPPKYEAFVVFRNGLFNHGTKPMEATRLYRKSFELDSTFYDPLYRLMAVYANQGLWDSITPIKEYLSSKKDQFNKWDKLSYDQFRALEENNFIWAAKINEEKFKMDPTDFTSNFNAGFFYNRGLQYRKAVSIMSEFKEEFSLEKEYDVGWRAGQMAFSYLQLKEYLPIHQLAIEYRNPKMFTPLAIIHLSALARMDSMSQLKENYLKYRDVGIYNPMGMEDDPDHILVNICNELKIKNDTAELAYYLSELEHWMQTTDVFPRKSSRPDYGNNQPMRKAELEGYLSFYQDGFTDAIRMWENEIVPAADWPDQIELASRIGYCYAKVSNRHEANEQIKAIEAISSSQSSQLKLHQDYYKARIYAGLGEFQLAARSLERCIDNGMMLFRPYVFGQDIFLIDLFDYQPFMELTAARG